MNINSDNRRVNKYFSCGTFLTALVGITHVLMRNPINWFL